MIGLKWIAALAIVALFSACAPMASQTATPAATSTPPATATPPKPSGTGTLSGHVTIGPLTPVERVGEPTPTPNPTVFAARGLNIFKENGTTLVTGLTFTGPQYSIELQPGTYVVDTRTRGGIERAKGLPQKVTIEAGKTTTLDVDIDTGIR